MSKNTFMLLLLLVHLKGLIAQVHELNEVLVEGKAEQDAIDKQKKALTSKIVISGKDLNNFGHHTVGDVLKRMPRVFIQGPPSFNRNIMMGGLDKQFQCVLINGQRPAGGEDSRDLKLDRIPADMVEEIEIIYNAPVGYGADATVGVINIKLKDAPQKRILSAKVALDNTSTYVGINPDFSMTYGNKLGKLSFVGSYSYNQFNRTNINTLREGELLGEENEQLLVNIHGFTGTFNYNLSEVSQLRFKTFMSNYRENLAFISDVKLNSAGELSSTADTANDQKHRRLLSYSLEYDKTGDKWKWHNVLNYGQHYDTKERVRLTQKTSGLTETLEDEDQVNNESVFTSDFSFQSKNHTLKAGARVSGLWRDYQRYVYTKISGRAFWDDVTDGSYDLQEYRAGAYVSDEIHVRNFLVLPAVRFDYDSRNYQLDDEQGSFNYMMLNPSLHIRYNLNENLSLKADFARQMSRPPFNLQVPVDKIKHKKQTIERGNKDLLPSTSWSMNAGVETYFKDNSYITFRGFYDVLRDVIEMKNAGIDEDLGYRIIQSVNVDSGLVWGIDVDTRMMLFKFEKNELFFMGNATLFGSRVRDASSGGMRRLNEQPVWIANGALDYLNTKLKLQIALGVNMVGERQIAGGTDEGTLVAPLIYLPYTQWDTRVKYFFTSWGSVFLNLTNIFNAKVETTQGLVSESEIVGRNIRLGVSMIF